MFLTHSRESQDARVAAKWHRVGGRFEEGRWERLEGQASPTFASYSFVTTHNFLSFSFLNCKILFALQGVRKIERSSPR